MGRQPLGRADPCACSICPTVRSTPRRSSTASSLARSNVSTALKELQGYGIVRRAHVAGDRRDHFVAETDCGKCSCASPPSASAARSTRPSRCSAELKRAIEGRKDVPEHIRHRIGRMHEFISTLGRLVRPGPRLPKPTLVTLMKLGAKVARFVAGARRTRRRKPARTTNERSSQIRTAMRRDDFVHLPETTAMEERSWLS